MTIRTGSSTYVHCPVCMEEWAGSEDEVEERCGYCGRGVIAEGEPDLPRTPAEVFARAKEIWPATQNPEMAGWLLPDGTMLAFSFRGYQRSRDHGEVSRLFEPPIERWEAINRFRDLGAIRLGPGDQYRIELSESPTQEQYEQLRRIIESGDPFFVEVRLGENTRFWREYEGGTPTEFVWRDIRRALAGEKPSEIYRFLNSKGWYRTASALPRGTFEPLQDIMERLSSSLESTGGIDEVLCEIRERLRPLAHFRNITASIDTGAQSITFVDDENEEACVLYFEDCAWIVEAARFEKLDRLKKAASNLAGTP